MVYPSVASTGCSLPAWPHGLLPWRRQVFIFISNVSNSITNGKWKWKIMATLTSTLTEASQKSKPIVASYVGEYSPIRYWGCGPTQISSTKKAPKEYDNAGISKVGCRGMAARLLKFVLVNFIYWHFHTLTNKLQGNFFLVNSIYWQISCRRMAAWMLWQCGDW